MQAFKEKISLPVCRQRRPRRVGESLRIQLDQERESSFQGTRFLSAACTNGESSTRPIWIEKTSVETGPSGKPQKPLKNPLLRGKNSQPTSPCTQPLRKRPKISLFLSKKKFSFPKPPAGRRFRLGGVGFSLAESGCVWLSLADPWLSLAEHG